MEEFINQSEIVTVLEQFQSQLYDISARNPFVNANPAKLLVLAESGIDFLAAERVRTKQNYYLKEYGLETTLKVDLFIRWKQPNKEYFYLSPLLYQPAHIKKNQKIEIDYKIEISETEGWYVNPILIHLFKKHFNFEFELKYDSIDAVCELLKDEFNYKSNTFEEVDSIVESETWQLIQFSAVGTFNYQKSILAQDFEVIKEQPNHSVKQILGFENYKKNRAIIGLLDWFPLDNSQKNVASYAASNSMVIQGPPGTGKSHTIAATIQHYVALGKKVLFVSEKKSALEVVYNRLGNLKPLAAYFDAEKNTKLSFYKSLKYAFGKAESADIPESVELNEASLAESQVYPKVVKRRDEISEVSISELEQALLLNKSESKPIHSQSIIPTHLVWKKHKADFERIEKVAQADWQLKTIGDALGLHLNKALFTEQNPLTKIDKKLDVLLRDINLVANIQSEYDLNLDWLDFSKLCLSASILNMVNRNQMDLLFEDTKSYKSFNNLAKKYQITKNQLDIIVLKNTAWKKRPNIDAIRMHELLLKKKGVFAKLSAKKSHKKIFENYNEPVVFEAGSEILDRLNSEYSLTEKLNEIAIKLKHNLSVLDPDTEIDFILSIRKKVQSVSHNHYERILEHPEHADLVGLLADQHQVIGNVNRVKAFLFSSDTPEKLSDFEYLISNLKGQLILYQNSISELKVLLNLPLWLINFIRLNNYPISVLTKMITQNELEKALKYQHKLKHLTGKELLFQSLKFNKLKYQTHQKILKKTYQSSLSKWSDIEALCATPHSKLSDTEKERKNTYKKAKRILIHEMNKTRQLMPVKDLFKNCDPLVTALQPIWILNPLAIAERLPLVADLFDVVIFDESSQIPFEDALPAIYRSTQLIVVGDSKQMPPSHFFSANDESPSLLDEAQKMLPSKSLVWHYRSEHPNLISFSNQHFYDNELKLFPAWKNYEAVEHHYIVNGVFIDSANELEARAVVKRYKDLLETGETSIGIIALSKAQEQCIRKYIVKSNLEIPETVAVRNLESVQGVEKKIVLISIGYARNESGKLNLNFGPINREQGANRLNVLFSRAIAKMEVFTSITAQDIGLSENRGLTILRQFLQYSRDGHTIKSISPKDFLTARVQKILNDSHIEHHYESSHSGLVLDAFTNKNRQKVLLLNPGLYSDDAMDLPSVISVLENRFKAIKIVLNSDWLRSAEYVKKEVIEFMKSAN